MTEAIIYIGWSKCDVQAPPKPIDDTEEESSPIAPKKIRRTKIMNLPYADNLSHLRKF